ncbi:MAG TPA: amidohydrolase family protein, partial [Cyclobacteriaceae bacterium]|nr:amidohydrolase family protein [Cyclobacteriaceae bacterium]
MPRPVPGIKKILLALSLFIILLESNGQETFPRNDIKDLRTGKYAFTGTTVVVDYQTTIENATLLINAGKVEQVGSNLTVPPGYSLVDVKGSYIYPSLIDIYTNYGLAPVSKTSSRSPFAGVEQIESKTSGAYNANQAIHSQFNAAEEFSIDASAAKEMQKVGFGAVLSFKADGLARGTSAFVTLGESRDNKVVLQQRAGAHYSFDKGTSTQTFPISLMGSIAVLRQTYLDASWYGSQNPRPFTDQSLEAWLTTQQLPQIFESSDWMSTLRADKLGDEFGVQYIIKGAGDEYKRIAEIKSTNAALIVPVNFPKAYEVEDAFDALRVSLADMKHWELAPTNLSALEKARITFAITTNGLEKKAEFMPNMIKAIENGLTEKTALKALTDTPARLLKVDHMVGSLKKGMIANFIITSGKLFDSKTKVLQNWIQGEPAFIDDSPAEDFSGIYKLSLDDTTFTLEVSGEVGNQKGKIKVNDSTAMDVSSTFEDQLVTLSFKAPKDTTGSIRLSGWRVDTGWKGRGQLPDGTWISWQSIRTGDVTDTTKLKKDEHKKSETGEVIYPFVAHGASVLPVTQTLLIRNATVWTNEAEGVLNQTDVLLKDGKIAHIGKNITDNTARVIDGTGKHLTAGIIDEHSHIAAASINDLATNSGMVRMGDVVNPEDINIYYALAGGVVAVQVLHGSANPIGGQSALIKLRWGETAENMKIRGADPFIKFALGENVKRSYNPSSIRYPLTRMGVEQVYMDAFTNAREYEKKWAAYNNLPAKEKATAIKPRRDLLEETMLEILNRKRFVTCHSYVQSEINMLMKVAEKFNFRINTFTHILE